MNACRFRLGKVNNKLGWMLKKYFKLKWGTKEENEKKMNVVSDMKKIKLKKRNERQNICDRVKEMEDVKKYKSLY